jgi:hypothetical protein
MITLGNDSGLSTLETPKPFPECRNLRRLVYYCPGWPHNGLLAKWLVEKDSFPMLEYVEYFRSTEVAERDFSEDRPVNLIYRKSLTEGNRVEKMLEEELKFNRGMAKALESAMDWGYSNMKKSILAS